MGISKKSVNRGLMRIGLICSIIVGILTFLISFMVLEAQNLQLLWSVLIGFIALIVVLLLFKILSWIIAGFFD